MVLYWNWLGVLGLAVAFVAWALAATVYAARPQRAPNRRLALLLAIEGAAWSGGAGLLYLVDEPGAAYAAQALTLVLLPALPFLYIAFLATLETPLARPLRARAVSWALWSAALAAAVFHAAYVGQFLTGVAPTDYARWEAVSDGPWTPYSLVSEALVASSLVGLVMALDAWRRAPEGSATRTRAGLYALAFGIRDLNFTWVFSHVTDPFLSTFATQATFQAVALVGFLILGYAILKHQLFDIDLRLKWTLDRGTVAAAFVAVFFVTSELAASLLSERIGLVAGVLAAGALVFALAPLQHLANRVSDAAMPHVRDTDEYRTVRRRELYRAAVESALEDGTVTDRERSVLATLAQELGLGPRDALDVERAVKATQPEGA